MIASWILRAAGIVFAALLLAGTPRAQVDNDRGLWFMLFGTGSFAGVSDGLSNVHWWLDIQPRFTNQTSGLDQFLLRPGLGYSVTERSIAWLGYALIETSRSGAGSGFFTEHRIWQQYTWAPKLEHFNFLSRTRLEQRFVQTGSDVGWRFRQFFKGVYPFAFDKKLGLSAYDEFMFHLNDTDWGARAGFDQNRLFAGFAWKFGKGVVGELGYLNQYIYRQSADDRMNHILSVNLLLKF